MLNAIRAKQRSKGMLILFFLIAQFITSSIFSCAESQYEVHRKM